MPESTPFDVNRRTLLGGSLGLLAVGALPWLSGCQSSSSNIAAPAHPQELRFLSANVERETAALADVPNLAEVVSGMAALGTDLHRVTASPESNWTASPLSIAVAFGMLRAGCRGETAEQLDATFGFPTGPPEGSPHAAFNALTAQLVTTEPVAVASEPIKRGEDAPAPIVAMANGLFLDTNFADRVSDEFLTVLARQYGAETIGVDFQDPSVIATINAWVAEQTRDRIDKLFDQLDEYTQLVLTNAVYLKATWQTEFDEGATEDANFITAAGETIQTPLMHQLVERVRTTENQDFQRITLPYAGNELTMRVVLPQHTLTNVAALNALISEAVAPDLSDRFGNVDLSLPRWDTASDIPLKSPLIELGITDAFDPDRADLTGIAEDLYVSQAIHRANVTVDERGTEAAAVTGIGISLESAPIATEMRVDRPFVWAVVHEPTGTPVFVGHVVNPT